MAESGYWKNFWRKRLSRRRLLSSAAVGGAGLAAAAVVGCNGGGGGGGGGGGSDDSDFDGVLDPDDNCPYFFNPDQADSDGDGIGDNKDRDIDGDGYINQNDYYPYDIDAHEPPKKEDEEGLSTTDMLLGAVAGLLVIMILLGILNLFRTKTIVETAEAAKGKADKFAKIEEKFKPKTKGEEMARCSECGKIIPMSAERCPGCGLEFED